ncbi:ABC transporter ATP-binding protein [Candidatus Micrarchaeota archaeon]|nr:ABC transporter ATP-binding protein [Candidatus Micrarchaeota archaeon]
MVELIRISHLSFSYGKRTVLSKLNLSIGKGEFVGIIGPVGSGKSTLLFTMNGVIPHLISGNLEGQVIVCGMDTRKTKVSELSKTVGIVLQDPNSQIFSLRVWEEVAFALQNRGLPREEIERRVMKYLRLFGLASMKDQNPNNLSEGQKQKLTIASTLAMEPEIILLDEPSSNLDFGSSAELYRILRGLNREGRTIIVVEHDTEMLLDNVKRILVVKDGSIKLDGPPKKVLSNPAIERYGLKVPCLLRKNLGYPKVNK